MTTLQAVVRHTIAFLVQARNPDVIKIFNFINMFRFENYCERFRPKVCCRLYFILVSRNLRRRLG